MVSSFDFFNGIGDFCMMKLSKQRFFSDGIMLEEVNDIAMVLIPKKNDQEELKDFRTIRLCNASFKVVLKFLVN
jgi:hypothetical protein